MAILASIFGLLGRFAGRLLNSVISWATILLFGAVSARRQTVLSAVALGSLVWVALVIGVVVPSVGAFLIAAAPVPGGIGEWIVRLVMLAASIALPLGVGGAVLWMLPSGARPAGAGAVGAVLRGYPFTLALALTIVVLGVVALVRRVQALRRHWESAHVPVVIKPGRYDEVLDALQQSLVAAGFDLSRAGASRGLTAPLSLLERAAGTSLGDLVPDRLMALRAPDLDVLVYPSDVALSGTKLAIARARAAIVVGLVGAPAYLTTSAESQRIEDQLDALARRDPTLGIPKGKFSDIDRQLVSTPIPFEEWETLYRQRLQLEREAMQRHVSDDLGDRPEPHASWLDWIVAALADAMLLALDVAVTVQRRLRRGG